MGPSPGRSAGRRATTLRTEDHIDPYDIRLGIIGCGGFGLFALQHFAQVDGVRPVGIAGTHRPAAEAAARRFGLPDVGEVDDLLARDDVDLVYIATPPFLHHPQAMAALSAGKHVICEKPLAMTVAQADEMVALARDRDLLLVTNLMQRYNPVYDAVAALVAEEVLGEFLHGSFDNLASDENLPPEHWFWDRERSGGIFVEHGVHFFDMFAGWLGPGQVEAAQRGLRPGSGVEEDVACVVRYGDRARVHFYHGFHQTGRMDRQALRLVFERGDVTLSEWVPTRVHIHAIVDEARTRRLCDLFPGARLDVTATYAAGDRAARGRGRDIDAWQMIELRSGDATVKGHLYGELLRAMLTDQVAWLRDRTHVRRITETNGRDALVLARDAGRLSGA